MKRELFICTGNLIPNDRKLYVAETKLEIGDTISATEIKNSVVSMKLNVLSAHEWIHPNVYRTSILLEAQYIAEILLSVISFVEGASYSAQILRIEDSVGCVREFVSRPKFGCGDDDLRIKYPRKIAKLVSEMSLANGQFQISLRDYVAALRWSRNAPLYLYRALESLCQHYCDDYKKKEDWAKMHDLLGTSRFVIKELMKPYADKIRHGNSFDSATWHRWYCASPYFLEYVRDTLITFLVKNNTIETHIELPALDRSRIPDHIIKMCLKTKHQKP